ncbi:hypothetical protein PUN28_020705 [Cardiocondyla obscurior]|uniref:PEP5/VPS11 N-terminal domain-containing protein n=1 Tax=Cardiocondyla obscurior TaxID=286306 RepID=A0AAW2E8N7_9HYME
MCVRIFFYKLLIFISLLNIYSTIEPIPPGVDKHIITVLDIQNKFIVFSAPMVSVQAVLSEWGGFFILSGDNKLYHLDEKDLQSKLALLFKKNLYDVSIRIEYLI